MIRRRVAATVAALSALGSAALFAPAASAEETESQDVPVIVNYSAMSDFLSCKYYPMRPWCPNASKYA